MRLLWSIQAIVRSTTHLLGKTWKPLGGSSFCQSTATPSSAHSLAQAINTSSGGGLLRTLHQIHAPSQGLLYPICTLALSSVASVHPQVTEERECSVGSSQERLDPLVIHHFCAVDLGFE